MPPYMGEGFDGSFGSWSTARSCFRPSSWRWVRCASSLLATLGIGAVAVHVRAREPVGKLMLATLTAAATVVLAVLSVVRSAA